LGINVPIKRLPHGEGLSLPCPASSGSAGHDLFAAVDDVFILKAHCTAAIPTGLTIALPEGFEGQVRPRSGMALNHNIGIINAPGTIDSDFRNEVMVLLTNFSDQAYEIHRGDRIAQLVIARCERIEWEVRSELPASNRGAGGFGHSGK